MQYDFYTDTLILDRISPVPSRSAADFTESRGSRLENDLQVEYFESNMPKIPEEGSKPNWLQAQYLVGPLFNLRRVQLGIGVVWGPTLYLSSVVRMVAFAGIILPYHLAKAGGRFLC